jgi:tetratricopeptide (TPR) repeat protein
MLAAVFLAIPQLATADGADDGNRGLQALDQGDNDGAIALFTHAIKYGGLEGDDQEFAYANRGRAYLRKGDYSSAIADLDYARQMKPDDIDAQGDLLAALQTEIPPDSIPGRPKPSFLQALGHALLQGLVDGIAAGLAQPPQQ